MLGLATAGSGAVGWLLGPFVGGGLFGVVYRRVGGEMREVSFALCLFCSQEEGGG